ncbi:hypothetical protein Tco_0875889 [Tanacetum coccineum]|uniref:Uncharacterized protein n=1 Tax=Tanacetum coccineum TaxID=301880 RepID=A0ABQ5BRM2_9ASTR
MTSGMLLDIFSGGGVVMLYPKDSCLIERLLTKLKRLRFVCLPLPRPEVEDLDYAYREVIYQVLGFVPDNFKTRLAAFKQRVASAARNIEFCIGVGNSNKRDREWYTVQNRGHGQQRTRRQSLWIHQRFRVITKWPRPYYGDEVRSFLGLAAIIPTRFMRIETEIGVHAPRYYTSIQESVFFRYTLMQRRKVLGLCYYATWEDHKISNIFFTQRELNIRQSRWFGTSEEIMTLTAMYQPSRLIGAFGMLSYCTRFLVAIGRSLRIESTSCKQIKRRLKRDDGGVVGYCAECEDGKHTEFSVDDDGVVCFEDRLRRSVSSIEITNEKVADAKEKLKELDSDRKRLPIAQFLHGIKSLGSSSYILSSSGHQLMLVIWRDLVYRCGSVAVMVCFTKKVSFEDRRMALVLHCDFGLALLQFGLHRIKTSSSTESALWDAPLYVYRRMALVLHCDFGLALLQFGLHRIKTSSSTESALWDAPLVFSTDDLGLDWIYAHNFLTYLQKLSSYTSGHFEVSELAACLEKLHFPALLVMSKFSRICFSFVILEVPLSEYFGFDMNYALNFLCRYTDGRDDIINIVSLRKRSSLV